MANASSAFTVALLAAVLCGGIGPRLTAPRARAAGVAFAYQPPDGFVPADPPTAKPGALPGAVAMWVHPPNLPGGYTPNVAVNHTPNASAFTEEDVAALAKGMPALFAEVKYVPVRHFSRLRADGARVGVIEGDCTTGHAGERPLLDTLHYRTLQMAFPDDTGTSIVTAAYPSDEAAIWQPRFEASIDKAGGVAKRGEAPPGWMYVAWGAGGGLLAFVTVRRRRAGSS